MGSLGGYLRRFVLVALVPGLRRDERFLGGFSISSAWRGKVRNFNFIRS